MTATARTHRTSRPRLVRDERGQGVVEFALILPALLLILVGILEFGSIYSDVISMRQGVREAGRQGSVGNVGSTPDCGLSPDDSPSADMKSLMCLAKAQAGVGDGIKLRVKFAYENLTLTTSPPSPPPTFKPGNAIIICAVYPLQSLTGMFQPFLNGRNARTKAAFRIEKLSGGIERAGGDTAPAGQDWAWCT